MNQNSNLNGRPSSAGDGKNVAEEAKQVATKVVDEAKQVAKDTTDKVRETAAAKIDTQKEKAAGTIGGVANALRTAGDSLDEGPLPDLAERAADSIESVANFFKDRTVGEIASEVERYARREPAIFLGASFALGLLGARFLKSSARSPASTEYNQSFDDVVVGARPLRPTPTPLARPIGIPSATNKTPPGGSSGGF